MSEKDIIWSSGVYSQSTIDIKKMLNVIEIHGAARKLPGGREDRKSTRLNSSHSRRSRMPSSA